MPQLQHNELEFLYGELSTTNKDIQSRLKEQPPQPVGHLVKLRNCISHVLNQRNRPRKKKALESLRVARETLGLPTT